MLGAALDVAEKVVKGRGDRFRDEGVLQFEVAVEAAVRQAGRLHQVGDAGARDAAFAQQPGGGRDDLLPVFGHSLA